jgi:hypothetical protein
MRALIILALLGLLACTRGGTVIPAHVARKLTVKTRTLLAGENAMALAHQCSRISPGPVRGQWTPSDGQIEAFEPPLTSVLKGQLAKAGASASPGDYYRQYAGFIINGRRIIYVNGVDRSAIDEQSNPDRRFDWRTQAMGICDGGVMSFGAEYDAETHQVSNFAFNGAI